MASSFLSYLPPWPTTIVSGLCGYLVLCSSLRYRRTKALHKRFHYPDRASLAKMTNNDAQQIQQELAELEFPRLFELALQFALFKTYGDPTVSKLLVETQQLSDPKNATKRYADTVLLILEMTGFPPEHPRAIESIARMNYLHGMWIKSKKISNDSMLYTLALFALEPKRWINRFEWRALTDTELCAIGTYWKSLGDNMQISYERLPSYESGWKDAIQWLEEMETWSDDYERRSVLPAITNKKTADHTVDLLLKPIPHFLRNVATNAVCALMPAQLREAVMYPAPPSFYYPLVEGIFRIRQLALRYAFLPRPRFLKARFVSDDTDPKTGRYFYSTYQAHPWYVKPTLWSRWKPDAWLYWMLGNPLPGDDGSKYYPEGYHIAEIGPTAFRTRGKDIMEKEIGRLRVERTGSCPFAFAR